MVNNNVSHTKLTRIIFSVLITILFQLLLSWFIAYSLHNIRLDHQSIFLVDLIGKPIFLPVWAYYLCGGGSTFLIWLIARRFFPAEWFLLPPLVFGISLWPAYLVAAQANSIIALLFSLSLFLSFLKWKDNQGSIWWLVLFIGGLYYFSLLAAPVIWILFLFIVVTGYLSKQQKRKLFLVVLLMYLPVVLGSFYNPEGIYNLTKQQIKVFSEPGLLNGVNSFKGESQQAGFGALSKLTENKYLYLSEYLLLKGLKHLSPSTYFTSQEKLLNFSFSPPLYLGFIAPFLYGLYRSFKNHKSSRMMILAGLSLTLPSILAQPLVDLHRLILIMPALVFIISYGLMSLYHNRHHMFTKLLLWGVICLVITQIIVSLADISFREYPRFRRYFGEIHTEVGKQ
ncbi:hypothetical protein HYU96_04560 [Candidatus Daviesbacteria bacterium]|nr:hypothetical protein [Candidatus Daviesbacteria bacterium]